MCDKAKLLGELDKISAEAKRLAFEETGWVLKKEEHGVQTKKLKSPSFNGKAYRVELTLDADLQKVYDFLYPEAKDWDPHVESVEILDELAGDALLCRHHTKPSFEGILKGREALTVMRNHDCGDKKGVTYGSVDCDQIPPGKDKVRSFTYPSGAFLEKAGDGKTKTVLVIQTDLKGSIPEPIVKKAWYVMIEQYIDALKKALASAPYTPICDKPGRRK